MPRTKSQPTQLKKKPDEVVVSMVRVRHRGGMVTLDQVKGTLGELRSRIEKELKEKLVTASYRDGSMNSVILLTEGDWPQGGSLFIGPDLPVQTMFEGGETINVSSAGDAKALAPKSKKRTSSANKKPAKKIRTSTSIDTLARDYVNVQIRPDTLLDGGANFMTASQNGALRIEAAGKHLVRCLKRTPKTLSIAFRRTPKAKESSEEVRLFSLDECIDFAAHIIDRQSGSKRRKSSADFTPSTRLLNLNSIASHAPDLFWSLFFHSLPSEDEWLSEKPEGDVPFMLQHLISQATDRFKEQHQSSSTEPPQTFLDHTTTARLEYIEEEEEEEEDDDDDA